ncbi:Rha family transcriptional regulator [Pseudomonas sp. CFBP 13727]|uniref:Rha family transcriptional regulator n=1 Tax=Pseudomonas sp. CFBP 13727 TaxID=2775295 RepID=UPI001FD37E5E|nr:Rha family transcriptional regulator [Pseudomonas sp. CFBP 13727]
MHTQITPRNTFDDSSLMVQHRAVTRHVMSSREIAEVTGKRHDHVIRDVRRMLFELEITCPKFGASYQDETRAERAASQPLITPKGLACLAAMNIGASL